MIVILCYIFFLLTKFSVNRFTQLISFYSLLPLSLSEKSLQFFIIKICKKNRHTKKKFYFKTHLYFTKTYPPSR